MATSIPVRFGVIGIGWRSAFLARLGRRAPAGFQVSGVLAAMGAWRRHEGQGPEPYPLAEACADHQISPAIGESIATGGPVTTSVEGWSDVSSSAMAAA